MIFLLVFNFLWQGKIAYSREGYKVNLDRHWAYLAYRF